MTITYQDAIQAILSGDRFVTQFAHKVDKVDVLLALAKQGLHQLEINNPEWKKRQTPVVIDI
jgi:hypothetical protein